MTNGNEEKVFDLFDLEEASEEIVEAVEELEEVHVETLEFAEPTFSEVLDENVDEVAVDATEDKPQGHVTESLPKKDHAKLSATIRKQTAIIQERGRHNRRYNPINSRR